MDVHTNTFLIGGIPVYVAALDVFEYSRLMALPSDRPEPKPQDKWLMSMAQAVKYVQSFREDRQRWLNGVLIERRSRVIGRARRTYLESVADEPITQSMIDLLEKGYMFDAAGDVTDMPEALVGKPDEIADWMDLQTGLTIFNLVTHENQDYGEFLLIGDWLAMMAGGLDESVYSATLKRVRGDAGERRLDPAGSLRQGGEGQSEGRPGDRPGADDAAIRRAPDDEGVGDLPVGGLAEPVTPESKPAGGKRRRQRDEGVRPESSGQVTQVATSN